MILIAILCPGLSFLLRGRLFSGIIAIILQIVAFLTFLVFGIGFVLWLILAIWAIVSRNNGKADVRHKELIHAIQSSGNTNIDLSIKNEKQPANFGYKLAQDYNSRKSFYHGFFVVILMVIIGVVCYRTYNTNSNEDFESVELKNNISSNTVLDTKWQELTNWFERKATLINNMSNFMRNTTVSNRLDNNLKLLIDYSNQLKIKCNNPELNKDAVNEIKLANNKLTLLLNECMEMYENENPSFETIPDYSGFKVQLEGTENGISVYRRDYNEEATNDKRQELIFSNNE